MSVDRDPDPPHLPWKVRTKIKDTRSIPDQLPFTSSINSGIRSPDEIEESPFHTHLCKLYCYHNIIVINVYISDAKGTVWEDNKRIEVTNTVESYLSGP